MVFQWKFRLLSYFCFANHFCLQTGGSAEVVSRLIVPILQKTDNLNREETFMKVLCFY